MFEAGQTMFAAAFLATRERADELSRRVAEADAARTAAIEAQEAAEQALRTTMTELDALETRRSELDQVLDSARTWHAKMRDALAAATTLERCVTTLRQTEEAADAAADARSATDQQRGRRREELRRAEADHRRAAAGLADVQRGLEELHRRAGAYHQAVRRLREAEECFESAPLIPDMFDARLSSARVQLDQVDQERREAATRVADADDHRKRHAAVLTALRSLIEGDVEGDVERDVDVALAYHTANEALRRHRERVMLAGRLPAIETGLADARGLATRQARVRTQAEAVGVAVADEPAATVVGRLLGEIEAEYGEHADAERAAREAAAAAERAIEDLKIRRGALTAREPEWRAHDARAARLGTHLGMTVADRAGLDSARRALAEQVVTARKAEDITREAHDRLAQEVRDLLSSGGPIASELLQLEDQLYADIVAGSFEDVAVEEAAVLEARLGAAARALIVDDPREAARAIGARPAALADVLLVSREADLDTLASTTEAAEIGSGDVLVDEGAVLRVSRIPSHPRLGRRAREARAAELRTQAEAKARELDAARIHRRELERLVADGETLLAGHTVWLEGDPAPELAAVKRSIAETEDAVARHRREAARHGEDARRLRPRIDGVRALLAEAFLLDPPDHAERAHALETERDAARAAAASVAAHARHAELVEDEIDVLRQTPLSEEDVARLRLRVDALRTQRDRLDTGIDALEYVRAHVEALGWSEAPRRLADEQLLVPALEAQLHEAEEQRRVASDAADEAEKLYGEATAAFQDADGNVRVARREYKAAAERFESFGIPMPTEHGVLAAAAEVSRVEQELRTQQVRRDELLTARGRQDSALGKAQERSKEANEKLASERREAEPAVKRWDDLRERAIRHKLLGGLLEGPSEIADVRGHVNLVQIATTRREILLERLRGAQGGAALLTELQVLRDTSDAAFADAYVELWLTVRDWLRRRLPAQVSEVDDPREALIRLRDQLSGLEERLVRQENDLRGASEDVGARHRRADPQGSRSGHAADQEPRRRQLRQHPGDSCRA